MKFTISWLKEHLDTAAGVEEIAETLTKIGLEVEEIINPAAKLEGLLRQRLKLLPSIRTQIICIC